jgi:hypothetical protein
LEFETTPGTDLYSSQRWKRWLALQRYLANAFSVDIPPGSDYVRGAEAIEADELIMRRAEFDRVGFQLFLAALQLEPPVNVSATTMRNARRRISQAPRAAERDLDDAVYLTCAVDGEAHLLTTENSDLRSLGETYQGVRIVNWYELKATLAERGLTAK